jgi:hypothetical protein
MDWARIVGFQWDAEDARKSRDKHGRSQAEAEEAFFNAPLIVTEDVRHSGMESRFYVLGVSESGRQLHITFTIRANGTLIRIISARDMSSKERILYAQTR